jgi:hypothetical protein
VVDVDILGIYDNLVRVAKYRRHLLQWDAFGFWKHKINKENPKP